MKKRIVVFFVLLALVFTTMGGDLFSAFAVRASATDSNQEDLDHSSVEDDLDAIGIDLSFYPKNPNGKPQYLYFAESCYTDRGSGLDNYYSLYVWGL